MSTVESDGFVIDSSNPNANEVRESLDAVSSPTAPEAVGRPVASDSAHEPERHADSSPAADLETPETPDAGRERGADGRYKRNPIQERIDKAVGAQRAAERERDAYRAQIEQYRTQTAPPPQQAQPEAPAAPQFDQAKGPQLPDFDTYEEFLDARAEWKVEQRLQRMHAEQAQQHARQQHEQAVMTHTQRINDFAAKTPDYFDKIQEAARLPVSAAMEQAIIASDHGPAIAYFLATHPEEGAQLAYKTQSLPPSAAAVVRDLLEAKIHAPSTASSGPVAGGSRPSLPSPIKPVGAAPVVSETSPDDLPFGPEYVAKANAQERARERARRGY